MRFDRRAWHQAKQEGLAPRYQFQGIAGAFTTLADALISSQVFMNHYVNGYIDELLNDFAPLRSHWIKFCEKVATEQAESYERKTDDYDGAHERYENILDDLVNNRRERREWIRTRILESKSELDQEIRDKCDANDADAEDWRRWHPPIGIFSRGRNCCIPVDHCKGFCPKCHEVLTDRDVWPDKRRQSWMQNCPACRTADAIDTLEDRFSHPFHCIPFTDLSINDWRDGIAALRDAAPVTPTLVGAGAR